MKKALIVSLASIFVLAGCSSQPVAPEPTSTPGEQEVMASPSAETTATAENTKEFTVTGLNYSFDLKEIKVKEGDTVKVTFKNTEGFHDFRVDEFNAASKQIPAGSEDVITFVANKKGTFEYYCSVGQHRKMGMVGKLIVE